VLLALYYPRGATACFDVVAIARQIRFPTVTSETAGVHPPKGSVLPDSPRTVPDTHQSDPTGPELQHAAPFFTYS
jgi:hypothetical protein